MTKIFSGRERTQSNTETIVPITPRVAEDLQADWNAEPVDKVEDARESLEIDAEQLRGFVDAESEGEDIGLPAILDSSPQPDANL